MREELRAQVRFIVASFSTDCLFYSLWSRNWVSPPAHACVSLLAWSRSARGFVHGSQLRPKEPDSCCILQNWFSVVSNKHRVPGSKISLHGPQN